MIEQQIGAKQNFAKKSIDNKKCLPNFFFRRKSYLVLKYNLKITLEVEICHVGSTHKRYVKTGSFRWFSLVHFWFGLVGFVFLTLTAVLGGNSTNPRKLKICMAVQLKNFGDQMFGTKLCFQAQP